MFLRTETARIKDGCRAFKLVTAYKKHKYDRGKKKLTKKIPQQNKKQNYHIVVAVLGAAF